MNLATHKACVYAINNDQQESDSVKGIIEMGKYSIKDVAGTSVSVWSC